jgi:hypothetical protein
VVLDTTSIVIVFSCVVVIFTFCCLFNVDGGPVADALLMSTVQDRFASVVLQKEWVRRFDVIEEDVCRRFVDSTELSKIFKEFLFSDLFDLNEFIFCHQYSLEKTISQIPEQSLAKILLCYSVVPL